MARVVLATGVEQLDKEIAGELAENGVEVASVCFYLEGILPCCIQKQADTVVVSPELAGSSSLEEIIIALRRSPLDIRVILLPGPGDLDDPGDLAGSVIGAGVYDIIFSTSSSAGSTVNAGEVARRILAPATYAEAEALLASSSRMLCRTSSTMQEREQGHIGDAPGAEANGVEEAAAQTGAREDAKRTRSFGLPKFMQGMIDRISKGNSQELLTGGWGTGGETEGWDPPFEEPGQTGPNSSPEIRGILAPDEEKAVDVMPAETADEDLAVSASADQDGVGMAWEEPANRTIAEDGSNWAAGEGQPPEENLLESLGGWEAPGESVPETDRWNRAPECRPVNPATVQGDTGERRSSLSAPPASRRLVAGWLGQELYGLQPGGAVGERGFRHCSDQL
jgi:hypothetical protein